MRNMSGCVKLLFLISLLKGNPSKGIVVMVINYMVINKKADDSVMNTYPKSGS